MAYGNYSWGTAPFGAEERGSLKKNVVNVPTIVITLSAPNPIVSVEFQYTTRKHNALERRSPCPE